MQYIVTGKQRKFVAGIIAGKGTTTAYLEAGYAGDRQKVTRINASRLAKKPHIAEAIEQALEAHGATPEFAVGRLKSIAAQDDEIGAARLASKDILELHGWNKNERPTLQISVKNAFFSASRTRTIDTVDNETNASN